jgi:hypothetical protein
VPLDPNPSRTDHNILLKKKVDKKIADKIGRVNDKLNCRVTTEVNTV